MTRQNQYPKTVGVRLSVEDREKLRRLCEATHRPPGDMLRVLVRTAQLSDVPAITFTPVARHAEDALA